MPEQTYPLSFRKDHMPLAAGGGNDLRHGNAAVSQMVKQRFFKKRIAMALALDHLQNVSALSGAHHQRLGMPLSINFAGIYYFAKRISLQITINGRMGYGRRGAHTFAMVDHPHAIGMGKQSKIVFQRTRRENK